MRTPNFKVGVIISTYNNPSWLEKVLVGYSCQQYPPDEIIVADDGSRPDTAQMLKNFAHQYDVAIKHIWHPDEGFQKTRILNRAIQVVESDYLIFTDQDCIPREDFVAVHVRSARKGCMVSGGYFKLPMALSRAIGPEDILSDRTFSLRWIYQKRHGVKRTFKATKLFRNCGFAAWMNFITPARAFWNGCNSSGWRSDLIAVNGSNEQMQYGGEDRELGERLAHLGIKSIQKRYSAICVHLDHSRPYKRDDVLQKNAQIRKNTRLNRLTATPFGIKQLDDSAAVYTVYPEDKERNENG